MDNTRFMEILWEATEVGILRWSLFRSGMSGACTVPELGMLAPYEVHVNGILVILMPRVANIGAVDGRAPVAIALAASDKRDNFYCLSTDPRTIKGKKEPHENYILCLYLLARRQWMQRFMPDDYLRQYRAMKSGKIDLFPIGWREKRYFLSG